MEKEITERDGTQLPQSGLGELPEDLRGVGPASVPGYEYVYEGDAYATYGGAYRTNMEPVPSTATELKFTAVNYLPRNNYESFRAQRVFQFGRATLAPSGGTTFTTIATTTIPGGLAAVLTGLGQWIGDASAYQKPDGSQDDISWRLSIAGSAAFSYGNFPVMISSLENEAKLYFIVTENAVVELQATNNIVLGSFGARSIPVAGYFTGHQFPIDEIDDVFRNR